LKVRDNESLVEGYEFKVVTCMPVFFLENMKKCATGNKAKLFSATRREKADILQEISRVLILWDGEYCNFIKLVPSVWPHPCPGMHNSLFLGKYWYVRKHT